MNLYEKLNYKVTPYIFNHSLDISKIDEVVIIRGYLIANKLIYNPFYGGFEIIQLSSDISPEKNLYFTTISGDNISQYFKITTNGKIIFTSNTNELSVKTKINLTGIMYCLASGSRLSLFNKWSPYSTENRYPSIYRVNNLVFMSGTMICDNNSVSNNNSIFTVIPQYCIPKYPNKYIVSNSLNSCTIEINKKGHAEIHNYNSNFVSLDGISYLTYDALPLMKNIIDIDRLSIPINPNKNIIKSKSFFNLDIIKSGMYQIHLIYGSIKLNISKNISLGWNPIGFIPIKHSPSVDLLFKSLCNSDIIPLKITNNGSILIYISQIAMLNEYVLNITNISYSKL